MLFQRLLEVASLRGFELQTVEVSRGDWLVVILLLFGWAGFRLGLVRVMVQCCVGLFVD